MRLDILVLHLRDHQRDVDVDGADLMAQAARDAEVGEGGLLEAVNVRRPWDPDRTRIDVAEHVAARNPVGRAHVHAGAAADAVQGVPEPRVGPHPGPSVVQDDYMELPPRRILSDGLTL